MKKQYGLEWNTRSGRCNWKSIGYDCPQEAIKEMRKKIKSKSVLSAMVTWNYVGNDVPDEELGREYGYMRAYKMVVDTIIGRAIFQDEIREESMEGVEL